MLNLLDVGKSGKVDLELLKHGLTSIGADTFSDLEIQDFYKSLNVDLSETKTIPIDQMVENLMKMLSEFN